MRISEYSVIEKPFKLSSRCMNLTGQKFGLLFAVKPLHLDRSGRVGSGSVCASVELFARYTLEDWPVVRLVHADVFVREVG